MKDYYRNVPTAVLLREVVFKVKDRKTLERSLFTIRKRHGENSTEYNIVYQKWMVYKKRDIRNDRKNYSVDVQFHKRVSIDSGYSVYDFPVHNKPYPSLKPTSTVDKGFTRKEIVLIPLQHRHRHLRSAPLFSPKITSYIYFTQNRVIVYLENRLYKIRNAGKGFAFIRGNNAFFIVYLKNDKAKEITALDIIHNLPKIRKELRESSLTKNNDHGKWFERTGDRRQSSH